MISTCFAVIQFTDYKTTVTYRLEDPDMLEIPGLTFCLPTFLNGVTLRELFPEYKLIYERIQTTIKEKKIEISDYLNTSSLFDCIGIDKKTSEKIDINGSLSPQNLQSFFEWKALKKWTAIEAFQFSRKPFFKQCVIEAEYVLEEKAVKNGECDTFGQPFESIIDNRECFTYFSQLNKGNKSRDHFLVDMKKPFRIVITIAEMPEVWLSFHKVYKYTQYIRLYVHPPNMIPAKDEIDFILLEPEKRYDIRYTKIVSHLMEKPYQTNCKNYNLGNDSDSQSRSDCIDRCILTNLFESRDSYDTKSRCIDVNFGTRKDLLRSNDKLCNMRFDVNHTLREDNFNERVYDVKVQCLKHCERDCVDVLYDVSVMRAERKLGEIYMWIGHRAGPYTLIEHSPEVTWFELFSNLSAICSLWIGFSVFSLYVWITDGLKFIYHNFIEFTSYRVNDNKINYNNENLSQISPNNSPFYLQ
jgi:hypothetical protein